MPDLLPGDPVRALDHTPTQESFEDTIQTNAIISTWRAGTPGVFVTFIAPTTGRVTILASAHALTTTVTTTVHISYELRVTDSGGAIVQSEAVDRAQNILCLSTNSRYAGGAAGGVLVPGLTPGQQYWAQLRYQLSDTAAVNVRRRRIRVAPAT